MPNRRRAERHNVAGAENNVSIVANIEVMRLAAHAASQMGSETGIQPPWIVLKCDRATKRIREEKVTPKPSGEHHPLRSSSNADHQIHFQIAPR
jgi:hypothetical protein